MGRGWRGLLRGWAALGEAVGIGRRVRVVDAEVEVEGGLLRRVGVMGCAMMGALREARAVF